MDKPLRSVKGMNDILPQASGCWRQVEERAREVLEAYGYAELRTPIVERTAVFTAAIGETTDVVEKEMYSFDDRNGENLSLRPEGTAGVVRAALQNSMLQTTPVRVWYSGPMFRYERPQRGRTRQFHQIGAEVFGAPGPDIDAEMILMLARLWRTLGLSGLRLEINTLGTAESRARYRSRLVEYFSAHRESLDADSKRRLETNPLRILDSKNPELRDLIRGAPEFIDDLDAGSAEHFAELKQHLDAAELAYSVNPRLVRGLDYYTRTVFEWITDDLGAQGTVCGGGRYDGLVELQGGKPTPAVGFSLGMERLVELLQAQEVVSQAPDPHVYLVAVGERAAAQALQLAEALRDACPLLRLALNLSGGSFKAQFKRADRCGARFAVVLGDDELDAGRVQLKDLRDAAAEQQRLDHSELVKRLNQWLVAEC